MRDRAAFGDYELREPDPDEAVGPTEVPPPYDCGDVDDMGVVSEALPLDALFQPCEADDVDRVFEL